MSADTVKVWVIDAGDPAYAALESLLDREERERLGRLRRADTRRRFVAAHGATRVIVGHWLDIPPDRIRWRSGRNGKPELAYPQGGLQANLSHSGELAAVAISDRRPVGVDVQELAHHRAPDRMAARFFTRSEVRYVAAAESVAARADRFGQLWVRKEACLKAAGGRLVEGLAVPVLGHAEASPQPDHQPRPGLLTPHPDGGFLVRDLPVPPGFRGAVALAGAEPYEIVLSSARITSSSLARWWPRRSGR